MQLPHPIIIQILVVIFHDLNLKRKWGKAPFFGKPQWDVTSAARVTSGFPHMGLVEGYRCRKSSLDVLL